MAGRWGKDEESHDGDRQGADAGEGAYFDLELFLNGPSSGDLPVGQILDKIYRAPWREAPQAAPAGGDAPAVLESSRPGPLIDPSEVSPPSEAQPPPPTRWALIRAAVTAAARRLRR